MRCPVFCYHGVSEEPGIYDVAPGRFREQVEWLDRNYSLLTVTRMYRLWKQGEMPEKPAVLTFDDGLRSAFEAAEVLDERDIDATFYVTTGVLGGTWEGREVMTDSELEQLSGRGHEIGAHSVSHPRLTEVPLEEARREVCSSKERLEEILDDEVSSFAYPYGDFNSEVVDIVEEAGFSNAVTTYPSSSPVMGKYLKLPRLTVLDCHGMTQFRRLARGRDYLYHCYWRYGIHLLEKYLPG